MSPLEGYGPHEWVVFERALVVRDLFTGGTRTFHSTRDAQDFRASLYQQYGELLLTAKRRTLPSMLPRHAWKHGLPGLPGNATSAVWWWKAQSSSMIVHCAKLLNHRYLSATRT